MTGHRVLDDLAAVDAAQHEAIATCGLPRQRNLCEENNAHLKEQGHRAVPGRVGADLQSRFQFPRIRGN